MRFFQNKLLLSIKVDERNEAWYMSIESIFTFSPPRLWPVIRPVNVHLNVLTDCATSMILTATTVQYPSNNTQTIQRMGTFESISSLNLAPPFLHFHHNFSFVNKSYFRTFFRYETTDFKKDDVHSLSQDVLQYNMSAAPNTASTLTISFNEKHNYKLVLVTISMSTPNATHSNMSRVTKAIPCECHKEWPNGGVSQRWKFLKKVAHIDRALVFRISWVRIERV